MSKAHCMCVGKALEIFVKDIAGFGLRPAQLQPRRPITKIRGHTRSFERRCLSTSAASVEDQEPRWSLPQQPTRTASAANERRSPRPPGIRARVNTTDDTVEPTRSARSRFEDTSEAGSFRRLTSVATDAKSWVEVIAGVPLAGIHVSQPSPVLSDSIGSGVSSTGKQETDIPKEVNRLARKIRRMQQGKWKHQSNKNLSEAVPAEESLRTVSTEQELNNEEKMVRSILEQSTGEHRLQRHNSESARSEHPRRARSEQMAGSRNSVVRSNTTAAARPSQQDRKPSTSQPARKDEREAWQIQKAALEAKFGEEGWKPRKRLSPDSLNGIRALHDSDPQTYTTAILADHLKVTPEAIRRILKSKWRPNEEEIEERRVRWEKRGVEKRKAIRAQDRRSRKAKKHRAVEFAGGPGRREVEEFGRSDIRHVSERIV